MPKQISQGRRNPKAGQMSHRPQARHESTVSPPPPNTRLTHQPLSPRERIELSTSRIYDLLILLGNRAQISPEEAGIGLLALADLNSHALNLAYASERGHA